MKTIDRSLFDQVFHEAQILDVDFSKWDKYVRLVVLASAMTGAQNRSPVFNVDFCGVKSFNMTVPQKDIGLGEFEHIQWTIMEFDVLTDKAHLSLRFASLGSEPNLAIDCDDVRLAEVPMADLFAVAPDWGRRHRHPLLRPSIQELARRLP